MDFEGTVPLPYEKIEELFNKYCTNKKTDSGRIMVGMAPGGWVRVWVYFNTLDDHNIGINTKIKITNYQLKGKKVANIGGDYINKDSEYWSPYRTYWNHHGIPYEVWEENEKEYNIYLNFNSPNPQFDVTDIMYSTSDGTIYYDISDDYKMTNKKLPADIVIAWSNKKDSIHHQSHLLLPKSFSNLIQSKEHLNVEIKLHIESNEEYGVLYLKSGSVYIKILRFKNLHTANDKGLGECGFAEDIEYFIP
jgi:hypothetical protein